MKKMELKLEEGIRATIHKLTSWDDKPLVGIAVHSDYSESVDEVYLTVEELKSIIKFMEE